MSEVKTDPFQSQKDAFQKANPGMDPVKNETAYIHWLMEHPEAARSYVYKPAMVSNQQPQNQNAAVPQEVLPDNVTRLNARPDTPPAVKAVAGGEE